MKIEDIGELEGEILVFGGVYSNLEALEALLLKAREMGIKPKQMLCTGDVVGYCGDPEACVTKMQELGIRSIAGNVEIQLREEKEDCGCDFKSGGRCDLFSRNWYPFAQNQLSSKSLDWMRTLPEHITFTLGKKHLALVHGSYFETAEYVFRSTPDSVKIKNLEALNADAIIAGHCGLPFQQNLDGKIWFNPGVIGMPANDGTPRVWFGILGVQNGLLRVEHHELSYDYSKTKSKMKAYGLPMEYANTLESGIWDNCEILPEPETKQQGFALMI